ncbi:MAG: FAD-dependent oxidoreductase [bacterium]|nr:FAD-dependent oxidoreductase [bacterium]
MLLFSPIKIGSMKLKNRIVMPAMGTNLGSSDGHITDAQITYYMERSKGGVGGIIFENSYVHKSGKIMFNMVALDQDSAIADFSRLADSVHKHGTKLIVQLNHGGRQTSRDICRKQPAAPSPIPCPVLRETPRELKIDEIKMLVNSFMKAAARAQKAGCDAVEFHMAHGYLVCQFLSPFSNQRKDIYGGSLENRARFALEILQCTRARVGDDFPLICRISADEMVPGGLTLEESRIIAQLLVKAGASAIHVSACNYASYAWNIPCYYLDEGVFLHLAESIKAVAEVPVIAVGRILTAHKAEDILQNHQADLVAMGRALIADPYWPEKSSKGVSNEIRPCLSCNQCIESLAKGRLVCGVNPDLGTEGKAFPGPQKSRKVLVIGGGPAGLEAARQATKLGHRVVLHEKKNKLGGLLHEASRPPGKESFAKLISYYEHQLNKLGVEIKLGKECTLEAAHSENPDAVIMATGSAPRMLSAENGTRMQIMSSEEILNDTRHGGEKILVIGGGPEGAEVADFLAARGKSVTVFEMKNKFGFGLPTSVRYHLEKKLRQNGVKLQGRVQVIEIRKESIILKNRTGRQWEVGGFDTVVIAIGRDPVEGLLNELKKLPIPVHVIGDASAAGRIRGAIADGTRVAREL